MVRRQGLIAPPPPEIYIRSACFWIREGRRFENHERSQRTFFFREGHFFSMSN